ncbi:uncharacterized protein [Temnothorax nylanderi]|uniref:uncharacterized protein n=1 Tax=Temnothorax nylanderi TaxID=102681 RepID=UPI003A8B31EB
MESVPGLSTTPDSKVYDNSLHSDVAKTRLKDAVVYFEQLLLENDLVATESSSSISQEAMLIGEELYHGAVEMLGEKQLITDEELILLHEIDEENVFHEVDDVDEDDEDFVVEEEKKKVAKYIDLDYKIKVVNIAKQHPKWNLKTLQKKGCLRLKSLRVLKRWEEDIKHGGTKIDKYSTINSWTYDRFVEARENFQQVTTRNLQQWALTAASQFTNFDFKASESWVKKFKRNHKIRQRKITKYVSERETVSLEETLAAAEIFRIQARALIPHFDKDFVINTDQTGCQYQSTFNRSLAKQGSKTVLVKKHNINKITHSYTAQYAMTLSGKLLPLVFVCLQESTGNFGPRVQERVDEMVKKYKNVVVTSSKSGNLTTYLYTKFLKETLLLYVGKEKFLLLIDSWGGQTNPSLYDEIFQNDESIGTCTIKVIPPKCTPLVQPCDVYFYRQVKNFIKRLQNCSHLIEQNREIASREDCIKIQSIVHNQLSSPVFSKMLRYAWFAAKLSDEREVFMNVNEVCFPTDILKNPCACKKAAFIRCARCFMTYCFPCFYDEYHPDSCTDSSPSDN